MNGIQVVVAAVETGDKISSISYVSKLPIDIFVFSTVITTAVPSLSPPSSLGENALYARNSVPHFSGALSQTRSGSLREWTRVDRNIRLISAPTPNRHTCFASAIVFLAVFGEACFTCAPVRKLGLNRLRIPLDTDASRRRIVRDSAGWSGYWSIAAIR